MLRALELDDAIQTQDKLYLRAYLDRVDARFLQSILAVRNDLVRDFGHTLNTQPVTPLRAIQ